MSDTSEVKFSIGGNEEVSVKRKKQFRIQGMPNYRRIGIMKDGEQSDVIDLLGEVSKSAYRMYVQLKNNRNEETNLANLPSGQDHSEINMQTRALRELEDIGLIKKVKTTQLRTRENMELRVPRRTYMLNPIHLFPRSNEAFEEALFYWEQLV